MAWDFNDAERSECKRLLLWGLEEDLGRAGDVTSKAVIPADAKGAAVVVARRAGVIAGLPALPILARMQGFGVDVESLRSDGPVDKGDKLARYRGSLRGILAIERLGLNLLYRLSGVATLTARYVAAVGDRRSSRGEPIQICDTRKTTPGWRRLEKYAVRVGGGANHRMGLFDAVLIKDNHLAGLAEQWANAIETAVQAARTAHPNGMTIEIEVDSLEQLERALAVHPDYILLDNMTPDGLREAVAVRDRSGATDTLLEASGGVNLDTIASIAETGVDRVSVGALTHSAVGFDVALDYDSR
jgi:nicotinate-nucleotide pyrophosphorylase (carboxylating)